MSRHFETVVMKLSISYYANITIIMYVIVGRLNNSFGRYLLETGKKGKCRHFEMAQMRPPFRKGSVDQLHLRTWPLYL